MAHMDLHLRGDHDPDIELHLYLHDIRTRRGKTKLQVSEHPLGVGAKWMEEAAVDWMNELVIGRQNSFLVPLGMAREWGLVDGGVTDE